jgi:lipooligosaccharide transport system permease protein
VIASAGARRLLERNVLAYRRQWMWFVSGFAEPVLYLLSIGIGVGELVGRVPGPAGQLVPYRDFVAPGMMAVAAMNGAVFDTTFGFFIKLKYQGVYEAMLTTPLSPNDVASGEVLWSLIRGGIYATAFLLTMVAFGLVHSWWAALAIPAATLIGFAFAAIGLAASSHMRSWTDFDLVSAVMIPLFLFSGTFFPLSRYPEWFAWVVRATPLYQGVALIRALTFGALDWSTPLHAAYLVAIGWVATRHASQRVATLLTG